MKKARKASLIQAAIEFVKLQLAGNILFWGTYIGYFLLFEIANWGYMESLVTASLISHFLFFIANKEWVFEDDTGKRKTSVEAMRFALFMGLNFFINIAIITGLQQYFHISPYIGQFISALFFTVWSFVGLKYWVFRDVKHSALRISTKAKKNGRAR
jgi:putative flippase GtrA